MVVNWRKVLSFGRDLPDRFIPGEEPAGPTQERRVLRELSPDYRVFKERAEPSPDWTISPEIPDSQKKVLIRLFHDSGGNSLHDKMQNAAGDFNAKYPDISVNDAYRELDQAFKQGELYQK